MKPRITWQRDPAICKLLVEWSFDRDILNEVQLQSDDTCEMSRLMVNGVCVYEGNDWDFHPGCYGVTELGEFRGPGSLRDLLVAQARAEGYRTNVIEDGTYSYE